jgi:hypothetical protein
MFRGPQEIDAALSQLGKRLLYADVPPVSIVVCGGSALHMQGLATRTTEDVDVCAVAAHPAVTPIVCRPADLPCLFWEAVQATATDLGLNPLWLNTAAAEVLDVYGAPEGMDERLLVCDYGPSLRALFLSRVDQIHFKMLAAADPKAPERHLEDLTLRLRPTAVEARMAVDWLLHRPTSAWVRANIRHVVEVLGHADLARDIPN